MTASLFIAQAKSTLDAKVKLLADSLGLEFSEVDDSAATSEQQQSSNDAIVWQMSEIPVEERGVFYTFRFSVGAKTADDVSNMRMMSFIGKIVEEFTEDSTVNIYDYTTTAQPDLPTGFGVLTQSRVGAQQYDRQANYRMVDMAMRAVRY